jgi:Rrf2 family transcriptional regulator, iron-sulfur cluster assembly transcription factor
MKNAGKIFPGGGYTLGKAPHAISLMDIAKLFEQTESSSPCPFGHDWCGKGEPCPLHDTFQKMMGDNRRFMEETRLSLVTESR